MIKKLQDQELNFFTRITDKVNARVEGVRKKLRTQLPSKVKFQQREKMPRQPLVTMDEIKQLAGETSPELLNEALGPVWGQGG